MRGTDFAAGRQGFVFGFLVFFLRGLVVRILVAETIAIAIVLK